MNRQRSCCTHSSFTPSTTTIKKSLTIPEDDEITTRSHKSQQNGRWSVDWQCSSKHTSSGKGKKVINLERRRSVDRYHECRSIAPETTNCSPGQGFYSESEEDSSSEEEIDAMILDNIDHSCYSHAYLRRCYSQHKDRNRGRKSVRHSSTSLRDKYQPKSFQDIVGHEIITKVISNAVDKKKIAQLYLFHGPNGTGKTSTARIFAMALQCESPIHLINHVGVAEDAPEARLS
ncbi:unnamed protein product [Dovyalis caffra]|uniref:ATPase AAA-type core domain-containing protein n=1 Tax=Dovyalis caffra TaxID=77055 RepID=A0AAV1S4Z6_9ROSI|nr:unnamed protein product [Dovyalis caffra]